MLLPLVQFVDAIALIVVVGLGILLILEAIEL
jgi:hypothetical protein